MKELVELALTTATPHVYLNSTREQFERYGTWWCSTDYDYFPEPGAVRSALGELANRLTAVIRASTRASDL